MRMLFALAGIAAVSMARAELVIEPPPPPGPAIAIVPFAGAEDLAVTIEEDVARTGSFMVAPRSVFPQQPHDPKEADYDQWYALGVSYVVCGYAVQRPGDSRTTVRYYLLDVAHGIQVLGFEMPSADSHQLHYTAHQIADMVTGKLTGTPGIANTRIAYVLSEGTGADREYRMMFADADGENARPLAKSREPLMSPAWSPDRRKLAYVGYQNGRSAIYVQELSTGRVKKVVQEDGVNGAPAWSPDGTRLALALGSGSTDIYIVTLDSGRKMRLTTHPGIDTEPTWSPDGNFIAYTSEQAGAPQIFRVPVAGGEPQRLTTQGAQNLSPHYSPDGRQLALVNFDDGRYRIAVQDLASGAMTLLSDGRADTGPSWAPNGRMLAFSSSTAQGGTLREVSSDGRRRYVIPTGGDAREVSWSPLDTGPAAP